MLKILVKYFDFFLLTSNLPTDNVVSHYHESSMRTNIFRTFLAIFSTNNIY